LTEYSRYGGSYPSDYIPEIEKGEYEYITVEQIQRLLDLLPELTDYSVSYLLDWIDGKGGYYYRMGFPTGIDWLIDNLINEV
jgi:hypothetical protein